MKRLFCGGTVVSAAEVKKKDVLTEDGVIVEIGENIEAADAEIVDVTGKYLFPGFIDGHTHMDLEVSGTVTADGFETGTKAELAGGTTCIVDFATQIKGRVWHLLWNIGIRKRMGAQAAITPFIWRFRIGTRQ